MLTGDPPTDVRSMVAHGVPLAEIEAYLDRLAVDPDERSALWLLAWAHTTNPASRARVEAETVGRRRVF